MNLNAYHGIIIDLICKYHWFVTMFLSDLFYFVMLRTLSNTDYSYSYSIYFQTQNTK